MSPTKRLENMVKIIDPQEHPDAITAKRLEEKEREAALALSDATLKSLGPNPLTYEEREHLKKSRIVYLEAKEARRRHERVTGWTYSDVTRQWTYSIQINDYAGQRMILPSTLEEWTGEA